MIVKPNTPEKRRAGAVEQPAVVGRQTDRGIALINGAAKIVDVRPVSGCAGGKNVLSILPLFDIVADLLPKGVVVIACIADGQQVAVLGIEDEEETVEKNQGGFPHFRQRRCGRGGCDGAGKPRKNLTEDQTGKAGGDALFVEPAFLDSTLVERARIDRPGKESFAPEDKHEHLKPMVSLRFR